MTKLRKASESFGKLRKKPSNGAGSEASEAFEALFFIFRYWRKKKKEEFEKRGFEAEGKKRPEEGKKN